MDNVENVQMNLFDKIETYPDCTVEVYINTITGEKSTGWWPNKQPPKKMNNIKNGMKRKITKKQALYISEYISGLSTKKIADKYGFFDCTSVAKTIHSALGPEYKGIDIRDIKLSVFKKVLEEYESNH